MITYAAVGRWALFTLIPAVIALRVLPPGSRVRRLLGRAILAALLLIAAIVGLSY